MYYEADKRKWRKKEAGTDSLFKILWTANLTFKLLLKKTRHVLPLQTLFPSKNIFTAEAPHCPACSSSKPARIWAPTIKSSLFEGCRQISNLIKYLWDITANVMTQSATSGGAIHSDFEHLIPCKFAATLAWKMIAGNRVTQSWEKDGSLLQRYPGDLQKWTKSPKKRKRVTKLEMVAFMRIIGMTSLWCLQCAE